MTKYYLLQTTEVTNSIRKIAVGGALTSKLSNDRTKILIKVPDAQIESMKGFTALTKSQARSKMNEAAWWIPAFPGDTRPGVGGFIAGTYTKVVKKHSRKWLALSAIGVGVLSYIYRDKLLSIYYDLISKWNL